ncbi:hypothetical protein [Burkholderia ambifaria]|uniref:hypothetical protein n=1 Tax=Burkholderia ambifaria TaxID=152480 RepID=UPI00158EC785|nr:hypothetical protein [Burkholderia ambifaria]
MTVSSEGRKVPSCGGASSARVFFRGGIAGRRPDVDAPGNRASGSFCHGEYCAFMPIADLIDSGIESIGRALSYFFTRIILTFNLYPDKNSVILIPASGRPR